MESQLCDLYSSQSFVELDPENFANELFSAQVLSDIRKRRRAKSFTSYSEEQATKQLKVVKNVIQADPGKFGDFLEIESRCSPSLAEELKYTCGMLLLKPLITIHGSLLFIG